MRCSQGPRQQNGSDCGVYVLVWMHQLHFGYTVNANDAPPHWIVPDMVDNLDGFRLRFLADIWAQTKVWSNREESSLFFGYVVCERVMVPNGTKKSSITLQRHTNSPGCKTYTSGFINHIIRTLIPISNPKNVSNRRTWQSPSHNLQSVCPWDPELSWGKSNGYLSCENLWFRWSYKCRLKVSSSPSLVGPLKCFSPVSLLSWPLSSVASTIGNKDRSTPYRPLQSQDWNLKHSCYRYTHCRCSQETRKDGSTINRHPWPSFP